MSNFEELINKKKALYGEINEIQKQINESCTQHFISCLHEMTSKLANFQAHISEVFVPPELYHGLRGIIAARPTSSYEGSPTFMALRVASGDVVIREKKSE